MVDVAAFVEKEAHEVKAGEYLWVDGAAYLVKMVKPGRFKSGLTFSLKGCPPVTVTRWDKIKVTKGDD